jgi:hypothetical protein
MPRHRSWEKMHGRLLPPPDYFFASLPASSATQAP